MKINNKKININISLILAILIGSNFYASYSYGLELTGIFSQGGYIIGRAEDNKSQILFGKKEIPVGKDGTFFVGISRNQTSTVTVKEIKAGAKVIKKYLDIASVNYKEQHITGIPKNKVNPSPAEMKVIRSDKKQILSARKKFSDLASLHDKFIQPAQGRTSGVYGSRRTFNGEERSWHKGMDIANKTGSPVIAPAGGKVRLALKDSFFNGNLIIIDHGYNLMTIYAHLDSMAVKAGDELKQGDNIGTIGSTGRATGPHLHWGAYWRNMAIDPSLFLKNNNIKTSKSNK